MVASPDLGRRRRPDASAGGATLALRGEVHALVGPVDIALTHFGFMKNQYDPAACGVGSIGAPGLCGMIEYPMLRAQKLHAEIAFGFLVLSPIIAFFPQNGVTSSNGLEMFGFMGNPNDPTDLGLGSFGARGFFGTIEDPRLRAQKRYAEMAIGSLVLSPIFAFLFQNGVTDSTGPEMCGFGKNLGVIVTQVLF